MIPSHFVISLEFFGRDILVHVIRPLWLLVMLQSEVQVLEPI